MPATITVEPGTEARLPARPDGTPWSLLLVHGDRITEADTATELLGQLIPRYTELADNDAGHDEALWRRYESAVATAGELQDTVIAAAAENGDFDAATAGEEILTSLLSAKTAPYTGRSRGVQTSISAQRRPHRTETLQTAPAILARGRARRCVGGPARPVELDIHLGIAAIDMRRSS